ncbi:hypothetical protein [Anaeromicropila herbilytica]|uniref:Uncharacterized protein n=1 Tax=Anaeromicropila herbilytica TaxID=2785025 RepID=A0A7R7ENV0_9FIRM|nr:hypothetical protein [Anaeromicropila herbilytica]BCN32289.1 hypothetical protein bsdtb5_35840 [Anaeromicropila herbilytica]
MSKQKKCRMVMLFVIALLLYHFSEKTVYAGNINGNEASIISVASGSFTYKGKTYHATNASLSTLRSYLSRDDINLTAAQASKAISLIYANVEKGVTSGYIVADQVNTSKSNKNIKNKSRDASSSKASSKNNSAGGTTLNKEATSEEEDKLDNQESRLFIDSIKESESKVSDESIDTARLKTNAGEAKLEVEKEDKSIYNDQLPIKNTGYNMKNTILAIIMLGFMLITLIYMALKLHYFAKKNEP